MCFADPEQQDGRKVDLTPAQLKAYELVLDRVVPRLSAVEQTQVNELDTLSREDILARIQTLLAADPSLLAELVAANARSTSASIPNATVIERKTG